MSKCWKLISVFLIMFFCVTINVSAQSLNCKTYLSKGSSGQAVKTLQTMLNKTMKCGLDVDGIFGSKTKSCVTSFQSKYKLSVDGIVGPKTCAKLNSLTGTSSSSTITTNKTKKPSYIGSNKGYIIGNDVNIRRQATTKSSVIKQLDTGAVVTIVKKVGDWYQIQLSKNSYAYVYSLYVSRNVIVIDISDQILSYYVNGNLKQQSPVVTGKENVHDTPTGRYVLRVSNMQRNRVLRGKNDDGTKYASPVDYWMPFIVGRGIGIHDASWRKASEFNSSTYHSDGSHGCVNMQTSAAKKLYESIKTNTAVFVEK